MQRCILLFFIAAFFLVSCGIKAPPLPPESVVPDRVTDLKVKKSDGGITLKWTMPKINTDGTDLTDLAGFKVLRKDVPDEDIDCPPCTGKFEEIADITLSAPDRADISGDTVLFSDTSLSASITYTYVVVAYNSYGNFSRTSNPVDVSFERVK